MTHRQASWIALRRIGIPDAKIREMHAKADAMCDRHAGPGARNQVDQPITLEPGQTEEQYLAKLTSHALLCLAAGPEVCEKAAFKVLDSILKRN